VAVISLRPVFMPDDDGIGLAIIFFIQSALFMALFHPHYHSIAGSGYR
jgi:hypothetical protein